MKGKQVEAYCVKCKKKTEIKDPKEVTMKNGRAAIAGTCSVCGTKVFRIKSNK
jgi:NAD-dependent SIR2 family protein deacetylase